MKRFFYRFRVNASRSRVFEFYRDPRALRRLTPPPLGIQFHRVESLAEGSRVDFTLWMGPIPVHWTAVHTQVDPEHGFTDAQLRGPFRVWIHRHSFNLIDANTTEIIDEIQATPSNHLFLGVISRFMWLNLPLLFRFRAWKTRQYIERTSL